jgi:hypothetical protein
MFAPLPPTPTSALDPNARLMLQQQFDETVGKEMPQDADPAMRKKAFSQYVTHFTKFFNQYQTVAAPQPVAGMPGMPATTVQQGQYLQQVPMQVPMQGGYAMGMPQPMPQQMMGVPSGVPQYSPQPMGVPSGMPQYSPQPMGPMGGLPG